MVVDRSRSHCMGRDLAGGPVRVGMEMRYRCRVTFELNDPPGPTDLVVKGDRDIYQAVRGIVCMMLTRQGLDLISPIFIDITPGKVTAEMRVNGAEDHTPTFVEEP